MKKISFWAAILMAISGFLIPVQAQAQKGEKTLGLMGGFATYNNGGFTDLYFQYTFTNHVRIAPEIGYVFRNDNKSAFTLNIDMQFPFRIAKGFAVYPLAGFTFNNWSWEHGGNASRAGANFGAGFDIYLTSFLKLSLQGKYSLMNDTSGGFFGMGIGYLF